MAITTSSSIKVKPGVRLVPLFILLMFDGVAFFQ
jgi:hypothetical protein